MRKGISRAARVAGVIIIALVLVYSSLAIVLYSSVGRFPLEKMPPPPQRVTNLAWPTIGYPALAAPGSGLEVEFDFTGGSRGAGQPPNAADWEALLEPSDGPPAGHAYRLKASRSWRAVSSRWPADTARGAPGKVWHVRFDLPADTACRLYDLSVSVRGDGRAHVDRQPHAVSVEEQEGGDFTFVTLADIHVHRRDISGEYMVQTNRGIAPDGRPVFFERAIEQVNLIRPRFAVLLGDFIRAQDAPGDYQVEFEWFYRTLSSFQVPVFLVPGNHDLYVNEVDGAEVWEKSFGPLHYSFDFAGCHFSAVNTSDWPKSDRIVMEKLGLFVYPRKWQGQVLGSSSEKDPAGYRGQLAWLRDDLARHSDSTTRVLLMHHDPYVPDGEGESFDNERFAGVFTMGGGGEGRHALRELASRERVAFSFTGHRHMDDEGRAPWKGGGGQTVYANQTCVYFDEGGMADNYPGYRLVDVRGGRIGSFAYGAGDNSYPFYDGSSLYGLTDLDRLDRPALSSRRTGNGWRVESYLAEPMLVRGLVAVMPRSASDYKATGGRVYRSIDLPGGESLVFVEASLPPGKPGVDAGTPGTPAVGEVVLSPN